MIEYKGQINLPNANLGVTERTITANEDCRTCDTQALAREISHASHNLIPEQVANMVLENFCKAAVEKMSEGLAIQLNNGSYVAMRIFPDIHLKGGNINLKRAKELTGNASLTEQEMVDMAGELIDKVGVTVSVRAVAQRKFTELLEKEEYQLKRTGIITKTATASDTQEENGGTQQGGDNGSNTGNGGSDNGGGEEGDQN
jgi:uncharacterized membrane protein YgcG